MVTCRQQSKNTASNFTTHQTKPEENTSNDNLRHEIKNCEKVITNKKPKNENYDDPATTNQKILQSTRSNFSATDKNTFIQEPKSTVKEPVKKDACIELESNKLEKAAVSNTGPKFTDATFICNPVQKTNAILQETYLIENAQKLPSLKSESLNNEIPKTPKQRNYFDDISKLFEESCVINSIGK